MIVGKNKRFQKEFPDSIQETIHEAEKEDELECSCLEPEEIRKEFKELIPNPGTSRGRLTLYQKSLELQWSQEFILGKTLVEKDGQHGHILLQQDQMMLILHKVMDNQYEIAKKLGLKLDPHEHLFE